MLLESGQVISGFSHCIIFSLSVKIYVKECITVVFFFFFKKNFGLCSYMDTVQDSVTSFEGQVHVSVIHGIAGIDAYVQLSFLKHMSKLSAKL